MGLKYEMSGINMSTVSQKANAMDARNKMNREQPTSKTKLYYSNFLRSEVLTQGYQV